MEKPTNLFVFLLLSFLKTLRKIPLAFKKFFKLSSLLFKMIASNVDVFINCQTAQKEHSVERKGIS